MFLRQLDSHRFNGGSWAKSCLIGCHAGPGGSGSRV